MYAVVYDLRTAQVGVFDAPIGFSLLAAMLLVAWGVLWPLRARIHENICKSLPPVALGFCLWAAGLAVLRYFERAEALALADAYDAGKGTVLEGVVSKIDAPRETRVGNARDWVSGSFRLDGRLVLYPHGMNIEAAIIDGDRVRVHFIDDVIVRFEKSINTD
ncbi:hypothetical protein [Paramagnetospirillum magnetotacticum]|uniref:hypothetical protein n=1 Tax=Paramagnetospirillum magnetotacticum TaxID=188 RepID=UPI0005971D46|nr:hypothetical protein [Paramagnetospirillum magnetotacticum]